MERKLTFNEDANNYDKYRPTYPIKLHKDIFTYSDLSSDKNALEIGIGTGQATVPVLKTGCNVTAVELGEKLSEFVSNKFKKYKNFSVKNDDFLNVKLKENAFDLVYCATAFHWLAQEEAFKKVLDILKPNGTIALFWNHAFPNKLNDESNVINRQIYDKYWPDDEEKVEFVKADCQNYINLLSQNGFVNIECKLYKRVRTLTSDKYVNLINTYSDHYNLLPSIKKNIEKGLINELEKVGGKINIYDTIDLYLAKKP